MRALDSRTHPNKRTPTRGRAACVVAHAQCVRASRRYGHRFSRECGVVRVRSVQKNVAEEAARNQETWRRSAHGRHHSVSASRLDWVRGTQSTASKSYTHLSACMSVVTSHPRTFRASEAPFIFSRLGRFARKTVGIDRRPIPSLAIQAAIVQR